jgi:hypothetical protein
MYQPNVYAGQVAIRYEVSYDPAFLRPGDDRDQADVAYLTGGVLTAVLDDEDVATGWVGALVLPADCPAVDLPPVGGNVTIGPAVDLTDSAMVDSVIPLGERGWLVSITGHQTESGWRANLPAERDLSDVLPPALPSR